MSCIRLSKKQDLEGFLFSKYYGKSTRSALNSKVPGYQPKNDCPRRHRRMNFIVLLRAIIFFSPFCRSDCFWVRLQQDVLTYYPKSKSRGIKPAWDLLRLMTASRKRFLERYPSHEISSKLCQLLTQLLSRVHAILDGQDFPVETRDSEPRVSTTPGGPAWDEKTNQFRRMMAHPNFAKVVLKRSVTELSSSCFFPPIETVNDTRKRKQGGDEALTPRKRRKTGDPGSGIGLTGQAPDPSRISPIDVEELTMVKMEDTDDGPGKKCQKKFGQVEGKISDLHQISPELFTPPRKKKGKMKHAQKWFCNEIQDMRTTVSLLENNIQELKNAQECQLTGFRYELENFRGIVSGQYTQVQALQGKIDATNQVVLKLQDTIQHMARESQPTIDGKMQIDRLRLEVASLRHAVSQSVRASRKTESEVATNPYRRSPQPTSLHERCTVYYSAPRPTVSRLSDTLPGGYSQVPKDTRNDMGMLDIKSTLSR